MKKLMMTAVTMLFTVTMCQAQWFNEWFRQKKTQRKYLAEQIVALKAYSTVAWDGYKMVGKGLGLIGSIKDGEFNLHRDFFGSLKTVNPAIKNSDKVTEIVAVQQQIILTYTKDYGKIKNSTFLRADERAYIGRVYVRLLDDCSRIVDELTMITKDNNVEMKDDERLQRINKLREEMLDNYAFCKVFGKDALQLALGREREQQEIEKMKVREGIL